MNKMFLLSLCTAIMLALTSFAPIGDEVFLSQGYTPEQLDTLKADIISGQSGYIELSECHANITVPKGFKFIDKEQTKHLLLDYWNNPSSRVNGVVGALIPANTQYFYQASMCYVISFEKTGYIKDSDAGSIDYEELLKQIQEAQKESNASLPAEQQLYTIGWVRTPHYLQDEKVLVWGSRLQGGGHETINYEMRFLGKEGIVSVTAIVSEEDLQEVVNKEPLIVQSFNYDSGYTYADFNESVDKVSDWTIGGLIAGGVLAKTGLLTKIGIVLLKFWKIILIGIAAIGGGFVKFFRKNKDEEDN